MIEHYDQKSYNKRLNTDAATRGVTSSVGAIFKRGSAG